MHPAPAMRSRLPTLDYTQREEETDLVVPLTRRARVKAPSAPAAVDVALTRARRMPLVVDKGQLGQIMMVVRKAPPRVATRVPRLSQLLVTARAAGLRQQRHRVWMARIGLVALMDLAAFLTTRL